MLAYFPAVPSTPSSSSDVSLPALGSSAAPADNSAQFADVLANVSASPATSGGETASAAETSASADNTAGAAHASKNRAQPGTSAVNSRAHAQVVATAGAAPVAASVSNSSDADACSTGLSSDAEESAEDSVPSAEEATHAGETLALPFVPPLTVQLDPRAALQLRDFTAAAPAFDSADATLADTAHRDAASVDASVPADTAREATDSLFAAHSHCLPGVASYTAEAASATAADPRSAASFNSAWTRATSPRGLEAQAGQAYGAATATTTTTAFGGEMLASEPSLDSTAGRAPSTAPVASFPAASSAGSTAPVVTSSAVRSALGATSPAAPAAAAPATFASAPGVAMATAATVADVAAATSAAPTAPAQSAQIADRLPAAASAAAQSDTRANKKQVQVVDSETTKTRAEADGIRSAYDRETMSSTFAQSLPPPAAPVRSGEAAAPAHAAALRAVERVAEVVEQMAAQPREQVSLRLDLDGAHRVDVRVSMRAGQVHADFRSDSPELRAVLSAAWDGFVRARESGNATRWADAVFAPLSASSSGSASAPAPVASAGSSADAGLGGSAQDSARREAAARETSPAFVSFARAAASAAASSPAPAAPAAEPRVHPAARHLSAVA